RVDINTLETVDNDQWLVAARDRVHPADADCRLTTGLSACIEDHDTCRAALQRLVYPLHGELGEVSPFDGGNCTGEVAFPLYTVANDDHFVECFQIGRQRDVDTCLISDRHFFRVIT